jgi:acyl-homoserine lactone acylase PvdQ
MWSVYGPVIPDGDTYYSLHWTNLYESDTSVSALIEQNMATTYQEYITAAEKWWSLCFNAVVADELGIDLYFPSITEI